MNESNAKIGSLISKLRQDQNLTQADFAKQLRTSQSAVNRIEKGKQNLSLDMLARMSDVLKKPLIRVGSGAVNLRINGGKELKGSISVNTSKNAAVALLCASVLNKGTTHLKSVPRIEEVNRIIEVLRSIGMQVRWQNGIDLEIKHPEMLNHENIDAQASRKTRSAIMLVGALMNQYDKFKIPYAGGCELGKRTILPHIYAIEEFGVKIVAKSGYYQISGKRRLPSRHVVLYETGDTTTENVILAAAGTPGETTIRLASSNYMVQDLCFFLQKLGIKIEGTGTATLKITGQAHIRKSISYHISEDPVEAMTFLAATICTNSSIQIKRCPIDFLELELLKLEKMGLQFKITDSYKAHNEHTNLVDIFIKKHNGKLTAPAEKIHPLPSMGLNIDNLPYFVPICAVAKGRSLIHDWVYEDRALMFTEIKKIGVDLELADPHRVFINGPTKWRPADIVCPSGIRPAVMLLIGMLGANGISMLRNIYTINRGYEDLAERLNSLGASIEIISDL